MASNWWEDGATDPVRAAPVEAPKKAVQEAAWWEDGDTPEGAVIPVQAAPVAPIAEDEPPFPAMLDSALERVGGRLGMTDENYRAIGGDNQDVPKLLRPITDVVPDLVNLGVKAFTGMGVGLDVGAQLLDGAAKELGLDEALAMPGGVKFKPGSIAYDMLNAFPGMGMELGHLPGGRFKAPARDVLPAEVRAALNEQTDAMWAGGATPAEINRFNVKNGLRPYNKEELAQLEEAARVRDEARAAPAAEPDVVAPDVPPAVTDVVPEPVVPIAETPTVVPPTVEEPPLFELPPKAVEPEPTPEPVAPIAEEAVEPPPVVSEAASKPIPVVEEPVAPAVEAVQAIEAVTPEVAPVAPKAPPTASERLMTAMSGVEEKLTQQAADRSTELSKRVKAALAEGEGKTGREAFEAEKEKLKGALPTETAKNIRDKFSEEDIAGLYDQIKSHPDLRYFDTVTARTGLTRLLDGDLPRPSELLVMQKVFGADTVKAMMKNRKEIAEGVAGKGRGEQGDLFGGSEMTSTGPIRPEPDVVKPVDPDKFIDDPRQGDLFRDKPKSRAPTPADKEGQIEMFPGGQTTSTGPVRNLLPEPKKVDPEKYVDDPYQGDFFKDKPKFQKLFEDAKKAQDPKNRADPGIIAKLLGTVRQMKATIDLSMPGNQGWGMIAHPEFYKALSPMVKEAYYGLSKDPASYLARRNAMRADPAFKELEEAGVTFTDSTGQRAPGEEAFNTGYAQNIPLFGNLVEASDFGASTFLNELRFNVGKKFLTDAKKQGIDTNDPAFKESLASVVNVLTGRGGLGKFEPAAGAAATALFSPRFVASRLQMMNPLYYKNLHPAMRKEMAKSMAGAASISAGLLGILASMGADVVLDPKSADFAKIKTGNTRYDVFGGLTNYITLASRLATNQTTNSKGVTRELGEKFGSPTRLDVFGNFLTNKTAPVPNYIFRYWKGKNIDGTDFDPTKEAAKLALPMYVESQYDAMVEHGVPEGFLRAIPGFFGINTSTYSTEKKVKPEGKTPEGPVPDWAK